MATSAYRPSMIPVLLANYEASALCPSKPVGLKRRIEVWNTSCIVTNFGKNQPKSLCSILINPANNTLSGTNQFPYFPRGGPVPKHKLSSSFHKDWQPLGYVSNWGGMEIGSNMMYPDQVVDGIVHRLGGAQLAKQCATILRDLEPEQCLSLGMAVTTSCEKIKNLYSLFDLIVHTTPPFYHDSCHHSKGGEMELLEQCYISSMKEIEKIMLGSTAVQKTEHNSIFNRWSKLFYSKDVVCSNTRIRRVGVPLIGAGARGFPISLAINAAVKQSFLWMIQDDRSDFSLEESECILAFGIPDPRTADLLVTEMDRKMKEITSAI